MSVKRMGSKLVQGVRQIKAQQDEAPPARVAETVTDVEKASVAPVAAKPALAKVIDASVLHPDRVWPD